MSEDTGTRTAEACAECGAPAALPCHVCQRPLCWQHIVTALLVTHCRACWMKTHGALPAQKNDGS